jgi:hypothetical protein
MKTNDITVCAFPRSGITYLGFLLAAARLHHNDIDLLPTFYNIDFLLVDTHKWAGIDRVQLSDFPWTDGLGQLFKTHEPRDRLLTYHNMNVIYLLRDPAAALGSYFHYRRQLGSTDTMEQFLEGPEGIAAWNTHVKSWLIDNRNPSQSLYLLEYEALRAHPAEELYALLMSLGLLVSTDCVDHALNMARIERMRLAEQIFARHNPVYARYHLDFVRPGEQRFCDELTPDLRVRIERLTRETYDAARHCVEHSP